MGGRSEQSASPKQRATRRVFPAASATARCDALAFPRVSVFRETRLPRCFHSPRAKVTNSTLAVAVARSRMAHVLLTVSRLANSWRFAAGEHDENPRVYDIRDRLCERLRQQRDRK